MHFEQPFLGLVRTVFIFTIPNCITLILPLSNTQSSLYFLHAPLLAGRGIKQVQGHDCRAANWCGAVQHW
jgi:hypothetical protein